MKRAIHCVLHRRLKPLTPNTNKFTGKLSKTKENVKDGTPSNHLEEAESRDLGRISCFLRVAVGRQRKNKAIVTRSPEIAVAFTIMDGIQFCFVPAIDHTGIHFPCRSGVPHGSIFGHIQHQMSIKPSSGIHISLLGMSRPTRVVVNDLKDGTYFARLIVSEEDELQQKMIIEIDARPGDCVAMAIQQSASP